MSDDESNQGDVKMGDEEKEQEEEMKVDEDQPATQNSSSPSQELFSPELLKMYYTRLFPYELLHSWLCYDGTDKNNLSKSRSTTSNKASSNLLFSRREFSFTIEPIPGEEVYMRYQSFSTENQLRDAVNNKCPRKIDIGAVFSMPPKDHTTVPNFSKLTSQRELVFDIDLTDYDPVRFCGCSEARICPKCWTFMTMAIKVMDKGLREDFGFEQIAWIYSGRRGVHAWVCDECARTLSDQSRASIAQYFDVNLGDGKTKGEDLPHPLHPMMERAFETLEPLFIESYLPASGHGLLASQERWEELLDTLPKAAEPVKDKMLQNWNNLRDNSTPAEKWEELRRNLKIFCKPSSSSSKSKKSAKLYTGDEGAKMEVWPVQTVFRCTYPRLDINVSKMQNHLLKSPFCIHPKTGRVCVPIDIEHVEDFDPFQVPTLPQLMKELDEYEKKQREQEEKSDGEQSRKVKHDWEKTSLKDPFGTFQKKFLVPMLADLRRSNREEVEKKAAAMGDF